MVVFELWSLARTSESKLSRGPGLSLFSKNTVPSRPNFGMRMMMAFFLTNRMKPSSFKMPLFLKKSCWVNIGGVLTGVTEKNEDASVIGSVS